MNAPPAVCLVAATRRDTQPGAQRSRHVQSKRQTRTSTPTTHAESPPCACASGDPRSARTTRFDKELRAADGDRTGSWQARGVPARAHLLGGSRCAGRRRRDHRGRSDLGGGERRRDARTAAYRQPCRPGGRRLPAPPPGRHWRVPRPAGASRRPGRPVDRPRLAGLVNDVVIEGGNSLYQDVMDRFVSGQLVDNAQLRAVWRNTTNSPLAIRDECSASFRMRTWG